MGASSSTDQKVPNEQKEAETLAASTGALPLLQTAFSRLADPNTIAIPINSLQQCFCLNYRNPICEARAVPDSFPQLLDTLGQSIADLFFTPEKGGLSWVEFLRRYIECCGRKSASMSLNTLLRLYSSMLTKVGLPSKLEFGSDDDDCKVSGSLKPIDVFMFLWMCWTMLWDSRTVKFVKGERNLCFPDIELLVLSAIESCSELGSGLNVWDSDISGLDVQLPVWKFVTWALATTPYLSDCFVQFINARLKRLVASKEEDSGPSSSLPEEESMKSYDNILLSRGRAWAISLTVTGGIQEEILRACFPDDATTEDNLLYRSSLQGRGLNRFWSNVEGYHGPLLILVSATSGNDSESSSSARKWTIGVLMHQGFENKDGFYGNSGNLYAISPVFHFYSPSGREKNFVYSHLHPAVRSYEAHPKPVGIAFGGTIGNERIFIDEDFAKVIIRHHAVDKTYQHGLLFPSQGYLPVEALISEVEVWGLGGRRAKEMQSAYRKREDLFTEQRRKVDLKTFANWEDSPEKMMMDMMSNPNAARREER